MSETITNSGNLPIVAMSKETIRKSSIILKELERKCKRFFPNTQLKAEHVFMCFFQDDETKLLGMSLFDNDEVAILAPETLNTDDRQKLFKAFAETFRPKSKLIVFQRSDYNSAEKAFDGKYVVVELMS